MLETFISTTTGVDLPVGKPAPSTSAWLQALSPAPNTPERIELATLPFVIGRGETCQLPLDSACVSRQHAKIMQEDGAYVLYDLGSTNGTKRNGESIKRVVLADGDQISIANIPFEFCCRRPGTPDLQAATAPPSALASSMVDPGLCVPSYTQQIERRQAWEQFSVGPIPRVCCMKSCADHRSLGWVCQVPNTAGPAEEFRKAQHLAGLGQLFAGASAFRNSLRRSDVSIANEVPQPCGEIEESLLDQPIELLVPLDCGLMNSLEFTSWLQAWPVAETSPLRWTGLIQDHAGLTAADIESAVARLTDHHWGWAWEVDLPTPRVLEGISKLPPRALVFRPPLITQLRQGGDSAQAARRQLAALLTHKVPLYASGVDHPEQVATAKAAGLTGFYGLASGGARLWPLPERTGNYPHRHLAGTRPDEHDEATA